MHIQFCCLKPEKKQHTTNKHKNTTKNTFKNKYPQLCNANKKFIYEATAFNHIRKAKSHAQSRNLYSWKSVRMSVCLYFANFPLSFFQGRRDNTGHTTLHIHPSCPPHSAVHQH